MKVHLGSVWALLCLTPFSLAGSAAAQPRVQPPVPEAWPWTICTRATIGGDSERSDPEGFHVYSPIGLEVSLRRALGRPFSLELSLAVESREVDFVDAAGVEASLGSLEALPINLQVQVHPRLWASVHPYAGAGLNATIFWEKSGALNSSDIGPSLGPAAHIGVDIDLSATVRLNLDVRSNRLRAKIEGDTERPATLEIDPLTMGVGLALRY